MQRDLPAIIGVLAFILVVVVLVFANNGTKSLSLSDSNAIPTSLILGATSTPYPTQIVVTSTPSIPLITMTPTPTLTITPPIKTPTPTVTTTTTNPSPTQKLFTCRDVTPKSKILAGEFMSAHEESIESGTPAEEKTQRERKARKVLNLLSTPYSSDDISKLSYWLGEDVNNEVRLYSTTPTTYIADEFKYPGSLDDKGEDKDIRGTRRCQLVVTERRIIRDQEQTISDDVVTRYLDFSLDTIDGSLELTAFRLRSTTIGDSGKYSGFN